MTPRRLLAMGCCDCSLIAGAEHYTMSHALATKVAPTWKNILHDRVHFGWPNELMEVRGSALVYAPGMTTAIEQRQHRVFPPPAMCICDYTSYSYTAYSRTPIIKARKCSHLQKRHTSVKIRMNSIVDLQPLVKWEYNFVRASDVVASIDLLTIYASTFRRIIVQWATDHAFRQTLGTRGKPLIECYADWLTRDDV